eukprot:5119827-Prymnesium_polylepis.1
MEERMEERINGCRVSGVWWRSVMQRVVLGRGGGGGGAWRKLLRIEEGGAHAKPLSAEREEGLVQRTHTGGIQGGRRDGASHCALKGGVEGGVRAGGRTAIFRKP